MIQIFLKLLGSKFAKLAGLIILIVMLYVVRALVPYLRENTALIYWHLAALIIVMIWAVWMFFDYQRTKKRNQALTDGLMDEASKDEASVRPDRREAYRSARENLEYAINLLEKSRPKNYKGSALYRLPWIMVVGPPSDGKTTAIKNAGIRFPQDPRMDEADGVAGMDREVEGAGGTRGCNWFFSSDAVILDTAGRWEARDQGEVDEQEWLHFLKMLQKHRPRRPVNGVIALCSIEKVLEGRETAQDWARKIRRQINEIMEHLGTHVPVYLIINKCDLIHGFVEYFRYMSEAECNQIWGFTRKYDPQIRKSGDGLSSERDAILEDINVELEQLGRVLEQLRMYRLADPELFPAERAALCAFPFEFEEIKEPLKRFCADVFYENPYGHNPVLRGVYFTSATQTTGNPILQLMKQVAGDIELASESISYSSGQTVRSYFLHNLMEDVVFKDDQLGGRFKKSLYDRGRKAIAVGIGILALSLGAWMTGSYFVNKGQNQQLKNHIIDVKQLDWTSVDVDESDSLSLATMDNLRTGLIDYVNTGSWYGLFNKLLGVNETNPLVTEGRHLLARRTEDTFIRAAYTSSSSSMTDWDSDFLTSLVSLQTYLYLTEPERRKYINPRVISQYILDHSFAHITEAETRDRFMIILIDLVDYYVAYLTDKSEFLSDPQDIQRAANQVRDNWNPENIQKQLVQKLGDLDPEFRPADDYPPVYSSGSVPWVYTSEGYNSKVKPMLEETYQSYLADSILISALDSGMLNADVNPLIGSYEDECKARWQEFHRRLNINMKAPNVWKQLGEKDDNNLKKLFLAISANTDFENQELKSYFDALHQFSGYEGQGLIDNAVAGASGEGKNKKASSLDDYLEKVVQLSALVDGIKKGKSSPSEVRPEIVSLTSELDPDAFVLGSLADMQTTLKEPFNAAISLCSNAQSNELNSEWRENVLNEFGVVLRSKFPFGDQGYNDADFDKARSFFSKQGALFNFHASNSERVRKAGRRFTSEYNTALQNARAINDFLNSDNPTVRLKFSTKLVPKTLVTLIAKVNGVEKMDFHNAGDEILTLSLPNDGEITFRLELDKEITRAPVSFHGSWAALKIIDDGYLTGMKFIGYKQNPVVKFIVLGNSDEMLKLMKDFSLPSRIIR